MALMFMFAHTFNTLIRVKDPSTISISTSCKTFHPQIHDPQPPLSDESSFYGIIPPPLPSPYPSNPLTSAPPPGSDTETTSLEEQVSNYDINYYWRVIHPHLFATIQHHRLTIQAASSSSPPTSNPNTDPTTPSSTSTPETLTPNKPIIKRNRPSPNEPIPSFLARLPPSTTLIEPWIYIQSPTYTTPDTNIPKLLTEGRIALEAYENQKSVLQAQRDASTTSTAKGGLTRRLNTLRQNLEKRIAAIAKETKMVSGKWMLFVTPERVDEVWGVVAEATARGELGTGAKVATAEGEGAGAGAGRARLIAIYNKDFGDKREVERVLRGLVELGLVKVGERPIYYKCDAYTYLGIDGKNTWGLRASLFSSRDFLGKGE
ncbi:DUF1917-domain-containing protein [Aspergillus sclerotioniger CBS 115572]|uniref:DUF1917-domain-containing protein n=1 Tax=Aspergillus sclerotioniger CBS 115572 TaxID=1450535 RepID=A0A317WNK5_9EURO|nr:DUF1917-domain-containing protein [Aspergillus sclerotioniger CBS 115572]PWY88016.1 DUF1917-domain-containing protein [Aspergillus sclerotioniger CBS 115572]